MPRPVRPWFRFYVEAFSDRKLRRLKPEYRWLFAACLGAARQSPEPGTLLVAAGVPMTLHDIADFAGMDVRSVRAGLAALKELGLIVEGSPTDHGRIGGGIAYRSPTFQARQFESDDVTKRTRKYRSTSTNTDEGTFQRRSRERSGNGHGNVPETETETETDKNASRSTRRAPEKPLADDWQPTEKHRAYARERKIDIDREVTAFRGHAEANDRRQRSWDGAFTTWLAKAKPTLTVVDERRPSFWDRDVTGMGKR